MNKLIQPATRYISLISAIALVAVLFLPLWRIELDAPQYPEGLELIIYPNKLSGDVDVINGLNHYIGMRTLHVEDFPEFKFLPYIIGTLAAFGFIAFMAKRKWIFRAWAISYILFGIIAMIDFYRWEYNYGHDLDPTAPIQVPGMSYQPPFIGFKQLLNFGAFSIPDSGGWIFIAVGIALLTGLILEWKKRNIPITSRSAAIAMLCIMLTSCSAGPQPIKVGKDACTFCKMTVTDARFACEIITDKGRVMVFDDLHCLFSYQKQQKDKGATEVWISSFTDKEKLIPAGTAVFLSSPNLKSPMGGNIAAFSSKENIAKAQKQFSGVIYSWQNLPR